MKKIFGKLSWLLMFMVLFAGAAQASDHSGDHYVDHEEALALLKSGKVLPLTEIINKTSQKLPGKILEIKLEKKEGIIIYEFEFLGDDGVVMEMLIDAKTAEIIDVRKE